MSAIEPFDEDTAAWKATHETTSHPGFKTFQGTIEKPELDGREYRIIELGNSLRAVLIHDRDADKSAACLSIQVGHLHDPADIPGLAHFCEHMVTKGSKLFPSPSDFISFITSNGGSRNASTGPSMTKYWFSIAPSRLTEAICRLGACLHSPLFTPSVTAREIHAVDSENKRNLQDDDRRVFQLFKGLCSPHPWSKFGTGNYASLTEAARKKAEDEGWIPNDEDEKTDDGGPVGRETRRRMIEWTQHEYCAGRMTLAILGKESLDELTELTVRQFSPIPNLGVEPRPRVDNYPWTEGTQSCTVFVEAVKDYYALDLSFPIPYQAPNFRARPAYYLAHFIGHEGHGSALAYLKKKGWVLDISAGPQTWNRGVQLFNIFSKLTSAGYCHHQEVVLTIFNYISILRSSFPLPAYHFDQMKRMSEIKFRNKDKTQPHTYAIWCSARLAVPAPSQWLLNSDALYREWDEESVKEVLDCLTPERARLMIIAKQHRDDIVGDNVQLETEKWYGTRYFIKKFEASFVEKAKEQNANSWLFLPRPNQFIPTNLHVDKREISQPAKSPTCLYNSKLSTLWHKKDDQFWIPKGVVRIRLKTAFAYATPRHSVLTNLFVDLLEDSLAEATYDSQLAGLSVSCSFNFEDFDIYVSGYNDKLPVRLDTVIREVRNLVISQDRLDVYIEETRRRHENFSMKKPIELCDYYLEYLVIAVRWTPEDKLAELGSITLDDMRQHKEMFLSRLRIEMLVTGNFDEKNALAMLKLTESRLACKPLLPAERPFYRSLILPEGANFVYQRTVRDIEELNSSTVAYYHFGDVSNRRLRAQLNLLSHIIKEPAFSELRTKQQLGYIVSTYGYSSIGSMGLRVRIQSLKDPTFLEERIEDFLISFGSLLEEMTSDTFAYQKEGLIAKKLEKYKSIAEESSDFWTQMQTGYYDFLQDERDTEVIRVLTQKEVYEAYKTYLHPQSVVRSKLSVHLLSQHLESVLPPPEGVVRIENCFDFKARLPCSPVATPVGGVLPIIRGSLL